MWSKCRYVALPQPQGNQESLFVFLLLVAPQAASTLFAESLWPHAGSAGG